MQTSYSKLGKGNSVAYVHIRSGRYHSSDSTKDGGYFATTSAVGLTFLTRSKCAREVDFSLDGSTTSAGAERSESGTHVHRVVRIAGVVLAEPVAAMVFFAGRATIRFSASLGAQRVRRTTAAAAGFILYPSTAGASIESRSFDANRLDRLDHCDTRDRLVCSVAKAGRVSPVGGLATVQLR